jgi:hypothetical protein
MSSGGAIAQLAYSRVGVQDKFLTGKPQFNFIKQVYRQYDNFAVERININADDIVDFGKPATFKVKKLGQFLKKTYFCFTLPPLTLTSGTYASWTNSIGYAIIDYIDLKINGLKVDTMYGLYMLIWYELTGNPGFRDGTDKLTGTYQNLQSLEYNALTDSDYFVDLTFWYSQNIGCALPLLSLTQSNYIEFVVYLNKFEECVVYDGVTPPNQVSIKNSYLATDQIFVDDTFAKKFSGEKHTYIIKQHQFQKENVIGTSKIIRFNFNHPCSQLLFVLRERESENNNDWFNFALRNTPVAHQPVYSLLKNARLLLDGKPRNDFLTSTELSLLNSYTYYKKSVDNYIFSMPFCNDPIASVPSGTINFSTIQTAELQLNLIDNVPPCSAYCFVTNFNFLTIDNAFVKINFDT